MKLWSTSKKAPKHEKGNKFVFGKKQIVVLCSVCAALAVFAVSLACYTFLYEKVFLNVSVFGENAAGKTQEQIEQMLAEKDNAEYNDIAFDIYVNNTVTQLKASELKAERDWHAASVQALEVGRTGSPISRMWQVFKCFFVKREITPPVILDETALNALISDVSKKNDNPAVDAAYSVNTDEAVMLLTPPKDGIIVDKKALQDEIQNRFDTASYTDIKMDTVVDKAEALNLDEVYENVHAEVQDATITIEGEDHKITPHVIGIDFDLAFAKERLEAAPNENVEIPISVTMPKVTTIMLEATLFKDTLSEVTTYYSPKKVARTHNVALAAKYVDGTVLNPGEVFSYNKVVGPRTAARGFKEAAIFSKGEVVDGLGGGICQVSSTLYMASMQADLETVSRKNHSFYVDYAPKGQDATVVYGSIDFQFRNTSPYPIKIIAKQKNNYIRITIKGTKTEEKTVKITTKTLGTKPFSEKLIEDKTLKPGERVVEQAGQPGITMDVYRNVYDKNGKLIRSEYENKTKYVPMTQIVRVGPTATDAVAPDSPDPETPPEEDAPVEGEGDAPAEEETPPEEENPEQDPEESAPEQNEHIADDAATGDAATQEATQVDQNMGEAQAQ